MGGGWVGKRLVEEIVASFFPKKATIDVVDTVFICHSSLRVDVTSIFPMKTVLEDKKLEQILLLLSSPVK